MYVLYLYSSFFVHTHTHTHTTHSHAHTPTTTSFFRSGPISVCPTILSLTTTSTAYLPLTSRPTALTTTPSVATHSPTWWSTDWLFYLPVSLVWHSSIKYFSTLPGLINSRSSERTEISNQTSVTHKYINYYTILRIPYMKRSHVQANMGRFFCCIFMSRYS